MRTLEAASRDWWNENLTIWSPRTAGYIIKEFEKHLFPSIGSMPMDKVKAKDILAMARQIEATAPQVCRRIIQRLIIIFDLSIINEDCEHNPARPITAALNRRKSDSFAFLQADRLPQFYQKVTATNPTQTPVLLAFWVIQYTALRRSEAAMGEWEEIDFEREIWTIPAARMKNRKDHLVPLTKQTIKLLKACKRHNKTRWIFPCSKQDGHIALYLPICLIRKAGYQKEMTIHGARKVFSTMAHESGLWSVDSIELQLSHKIPGVRGIYNKAVLFDERKKLMEWHSEKIDTLRGIR